FRVPTDGLIRESQFFSDMFSLPIPASGTTVEGVSDDKPIMLPESISAESFRSLLRLLYPSSGEDHAVELSESEWISVLELSTMWYFLRYRKMAISHLNGLLTPIEKVCLGREYKVTFWVEQGYHSLVKRKETISNDEALEL
ncbi:hypothetical protein CPC08DRAFT_601941, partial [Agrocybe pediades]